MHNHATASLPLRRRECAVTVFRSLSQNFQRAAGLASSPPALPVLNSFLTYLTLTFTFTIQQLRFSGRICRPVSSRAGTTQSISVSSNPPSWPPPLQALATVVGSRCYQVLLPLGRGCPPFVPTPAPAGTTNPFPITPARALFSASFNLDSPKWSFTPSSGSTSSSASGAPQASGFLSNSTPVAS